MNNLMLAAIQIGGDGLINQLVTVLLIALCLGVIYAIGWYFFREPPAPALAMKVWNGLFILLIGLAIVNFLLGLAGHQFIKW